MISSRFNWSQGGEQPRSYGVSSLPLSLQGKGRREALGRRFGGEHYSLNEWDPAFILNYTNGVIFSNQITSYVWCCWFTNGLASWGELSRSQGFLLMEGSRLPPAHRGRAPCYARTSGMKFLKLVTGRAYPGLLKPQMHVQKKKGLNTKEVHQIGSITQVH